MAIQLLASCIRTHPPPPPPPHPFRIIRFGRVDSPVSHLGDTPFSRYCLQQNLYRYILETKYVGLPGPIESMSLVQLHPSLDSYKIIVVPDMQTEAAALLACFRRSDAYIGARQLKMARLVSLFAT